MMRKEIGLDKIPGIHKQPEPEQFKDADSPSAEDIVNNLREDQMEAAWDAEVSSWMELGLNPGQSIQIDQFLFKSRLEVCISILKESGIIDEEAFDSRVRRFMLKTMIEIRKANEENIKQMRLQMLQAQLTQGIQPPADIFVPPGFKKDG